MLWFLLPCSICLLDPPASTRLLAIDTGKDRGNVCHTVLGNVVGLGQGPVELRAVTIFLLREGFNASLLLQGELCQALVSLPGRGCFPLTCRGQTVGRDLESAVSAPQSTDEWPEWSR